MWVENFNKMRKESGMSLDELSEKSGVPKGTLAKITSGITKTPSLETMRSLVYAMGYTLNDLDRDDLDKKTPPTPAEPEQEERLTKHEVEGVLIALGLIEDGQHISDRDLDVVSYVISILDAWFEEKRQRR